MGLPVLPAFSLCTCCRHYPGAASECMSLLTSPDVSAFPERVVGSACAMSFSRLARRSLTLRPAHAPSHQVTFYIEGFSHFVTSMTASIASGWSKSCRVGLSPTGKRRLSTAHTHLRHSDMDLSFPIPVIGKVTLLTPCRHSIQISEWHHPHGERTVDFSSQMPRANYRSLELLAVLVKNIL